MKAQWLMTPAVIVASPILMFSSAAYAQQYLSVEEAQKALFPEAKTFGLKEVSMDDAGKKIIEDKSGVRVREPQFKAWRAESGGKTLGWFFVDKVIGKHEFITYACAINADGSVRGIEVLDYRETYGGEVAHPKWREQFEHKTLADPFKLGKDIKNISGGTLSCKNITNGVKRLLVTYETLLK